MRAWKVVFILFITFMGIGAALAAEKLERNILDWGKNYIESTGTAVAPEGMTGAKAEALARRGATVDLQRNLLEFLCGVQVDARTTMEDFMANDRVRTEVSGIIKNIELLDGRWDGESYTITGRVKLPELRAVVAAHLPPNPVNIAAAKTENKVPQAKRTGARYTGLVVDVRHLVLVPSMSFNIIDESGRVVYGMEFVNHENYLQSGLCAYYDNISYAKGELHIAPNPIAAKALRLSEGNVDIVISNADAAKVRGSTYDFRKECKVVIVKS